jgi:hypothetical protein
MRGVFRLALCAVAIAAGIGAGAARIGQAAEPTGSVPTSAIVNRGVVEVVTGRAEDASVRMTEEIAGIVDDGATRHVVPVVGKEICRISPT